jgi:hypothetical protein
MPVNERCLSYAGTMGLLVLRAAIPILAVGLLLLVRFLARPPRIIWTRSLQVGWIAGIINLLADAVANNLHLWHYVMPALLLGLPVDLYVSVALIYGSSISLIYWWIATKYPRYKWWFVIALPFYGLFRDYLGTALTGSTFLIWDSPLWWVADFTAWGAGLWCTLVVFQRVSLTRPPPPGAPIGGTSVGQ